MGKAYGNTDDKSSVILGYRLPSENSIKEKLNYGVQLKFDVSKNVTDEKGVVWNV